MTTARVVIFPHRYIQGPNILRHNGKLLRQFGDKCLVIGGKTALMHTTDELQIALNENNVEAVWELIPGIPSEDEVKRLVTIAGDINAQFIIGVGGGSALDAAKAVALFTQNSIVTVPTVATMESATSTISVLYDQTGKFSRYVNLPNNPELILVDSRILANAPPRFLAAGLAGALATSYAVEACIKSQTKSIAGGITSAFVRQIAQASKEFCFNHARAAITDARAHNLTPLLEDAFEIPFLFSTLSFESGGLAAAHAFYHGVRALWPELCHKFLSSEIVSFGTIIQLFLEQRSAPEIQQVVTLHADLKLPLTLNELNPPTINDDELRLLANLCTRDSSMLNMPFDVTEDMVSEAIRNANQIGQNYSNR